jgi:hypothetical protein
MLSHTAAMSRLRVLVAALSILLLGACQAANVPRFDRHVLDESFAGGYGVEIADVDGDGLDDIVSLATTPAQFVWYHNPDWQKYVISSESTGNIATAPHDIDRDGDVDLVLASAFDLSASTEGGLVHWLENPGTFNSNPAANQNWQRHLIDQIPTSHRVRWADVNGDGTKELINLPIIGIGAVAPDYAVGSQLTAYTVPADPRTGNWSKVVISDTLEVAHGLGIMDWDADGQDDLLIASFGGVELIQLASQGRFVDQSTLGVGKEGLRPERGSSEVGVGTLRDHGRFVASIEPWHGNEVVLYRPDATGVLPWLRQVIETEMVGGHALVTADLNNDGNDEIIAGHRSSPFGLYIYRYVHDNEQDTPQWVRSTLDAGDIGVAGLVVGDFNNDGFKDIVAVGSSTANVVLFENRAR